MIEQPIPRPVQRRIDPAAADTETLVDMGVLPEQPTPESPQEE
ncbi:hypothetical protein ACIQKB_04285 [Streptomyces sp. NPDC092046]